MGEITRWLADATQNKAADKIVDDTVDTLRRREGLLDMIMPLESYDDKEFLGYVLEEINTIASIIAVGAEPPLTQQGTFRKITAELIKTGLSRVYDEEYQWKMRKAMQEAQLKNVKVQDIRDPKTGKVVRKGANNSLAKYIFGTIQQLAKAQIDLMDKFSWDGLQTGVINHTDPRTKLKVTIDYTNPHDTSYNHFPAALTGAATWNNYATANGIQDLYNAVDTYLETNGFAPKAIIMGHRTLNDLQQQQSTKDAATMLRGSIGSVGSVSLDMLSSILSARQLPPILTHDERYKYEAADKSTSNVRFHQEGRFTFVAEDMGVRAIGPTLENKTKSGIFVKTYQLNKMSPTDVSASVAHMLPCFMNPKLLFSQQVI